MPSKTIILLVVAIIAETLGTACLKTSDGFTKLWPAVGSVLFFAAALYFLALTLKVMPIGIVYAIWSGLGIVLVALIGTFFFKQHLDFEAYMGIALILAGVIVINVFSGNSH